MSINFFPPSKVLYLQFLSISYSDDKKFSGKIRIFSLNRGWFLGKQKKKIQKPVFTLTKLRTVSSNDYISPIRRRPLLMDAKIFLVLRFSIENRVSAQNLCTSSTDFKYLIPRKCFTNNCYIHHRIITTPQALCTYSVEVHFFTNISSMLG